MGRGLDGYIFGTRSLAGCAVLKARGPDKFPVAIAWGKHLFPFRTEQLSPTAPMVLGPQGPGRVGRRRSLLQRSRPPRRLFAFNVCPSLARAWSQYARDVGRPGVADRLARRAVGACGGSRRPDREDGSGRAGARGPTAPSARTAKSGPRAVELVAAPGQDAAA